jgi:predicted transcriptional regulator of viral defense system
MATNQRERVLKLARRAGGVTSRELTRAGIHRQFLTRLVREGELEQVARGVYRLPDQAVSEHHGLAIAAAAVPKGIICLLSALSFHGLGTQLPSEVWMAIPGRARQPTLEYPPLRIVRFSGDAFTEGVETHQVEGQRLRVYGVAKTVADCFKYRNKVGLDVALEALREGWRERRFTIDELDRYAEICRVSSVMRPYVESLVS